MNSRVPVFTVLLLLTASFFLILKTSEGQVATQPSDQSATDQIKEKRVKITVGSKTFFATLEDSAAAERLLELLPLTLEMSDLNANEKVSRLDAHFTTDKVKPGTIRTGDLLLWQDDSLVLFYKTFKSSYSYTRLGKLDDPTGLEEAVGAGSVTVTFARQ